MSTGLHRWIVGCMAGFGTMAFVAGAAMLSPPERDASARIASDCKPKVKVPAAPHPHDA
jgi:hypothetical protein